MSLHFRLIFSIPRVECLVSTCQKPVIGSSQLPHNDCCAAGHSCGFWHPPADIISATGTNGFQCYTLWYDWEYVAHHIGVIGVPWVRFLLLAPPVGYVQYPKHTANFHWVGVVMIQIWIYLPQVVCCVRWWIDFEPGCCQSPCYLIASSGCHVSQTVRHQVFFIMAQQIISMKRWLNRSWSPRSGDENATQYGFMCIEECRSMFGTAFNLHLLHEGLLIVDRTECLVVSIIFNSIVTLPEQSQHPEKIDDMCWTE